MTATAVVGVAAASPDAPTDAVVTITLPAPTGPAPVGVTELHLTDGNRADPWDPSRRRELMVQVWYPADEADTSPMAPWMPPGGLAEQAYGLAQSGVPAGSWALAPSHGRTDARARSGGDRFPILLNSPGLDDTTGLNTAQAEDLASHGYIVVAINHTHEAFSVQFPDGRTENTVVPLDSPLNVLGDQLLPIRVADARFVLDQLTAAARHSTDATAALPPQLADDLDLTKVGMFGHSLGGTTAAQTMHDDPRIAAAVDLDGPILGSVATDGLDRPLLMLAADTSPWFGNPGWESSWPHNSGLKLPFRIAGTRHMSFTDEQVIVPQLATAGLVNTAVQNAAIGSMDPTRSIDLQRACLLAYFDAVFGRGDSNPAETLAHLAQPEMLPHP
ncbi:alpha/beta hydrolase family protein [Nocardia sp. NBC_00511]|uniref:alpha/beta hydrolase family protein n=1 Tax=Nocardia sp. NBC_00511 TaxID=2903591 RepID=UPI0030E1D746